MKRKTKAERTPVQSETQRVKAWLRTLPMEQRQLVIDELVATTLRTLEVSNGTL